MQEPGKILDLIEAIEIAQERLSRNLAPSKKLLLTRIKEKALRGSRIPNSYCELLCDYINEVEGRPRPINNEIVEESDRSITGLALYGLIPLTLLIIGIVAYAILFLLGVV